MYGQIVGEINALCPFLINFTIRMFMIIPHSPGFVAVGRMYAAFEVV